MLNMPSNLAAVPMEMALITPLYKKSGKASKKISICVRTIYIDFNMHVR